MGLERIKELKVQKGLTTKQLAELADVPLGTINKIISGITKDPQLATLKKIADALGCQVEDFVDHEPGSVLSRPYSTQQSFILEEHGEQPDYYLSPEVSQMAQEIYDNPELRILFDASRRLSKDDVLAVVDIVKRMKGYND